MERNQKEKIDTEKLEEREWKKLINIEVIRQEKLKEEIGELEIQIKKKNKEQLKHNIK